MNRFAVVLLASVLLAPTAIGVSGCRCCSPCVERAPAATTVAVTADVSVLVEVAVFEVADDASAAAIGLSMGAGDPPYRVMSTYASATLALGWSKLKGVTLLQMPSVVTQNGQEVTIQVGKTIGPGSKGFPDERGGLTFSVEDGDWTGTRVRLLPTYDGSTISIGMAMERRGDAPAIPATDLAANRTSEISIQVFDMKMRTGETAVVASRVDGKLGQRRLFATVRSTILTEANVVKRPITQAAPRTADDRS